jgi:hypothetical protein
MQYLFNRTCHWAVNGLDIGQTSHSWGDAEAGYRFGYDAGGDR